MGEDRFSINALMTECAIEREKRCEDISYDFICR